MSHSENQYLPSATIKNLQLRAQILANIRQFFASKRVLEVETPAMSQATVTDLHLDTFKTIFVGPGYAKGLPLYLVTSPEFHMKRLLAAGSGSIYQICKAFRNEEAGRTHNPEFSLLEWYRIDFDHHQLMDEMDEFLQLILHCPIAKRVSYQAIFMDILGVCPLSDSMQKLKACAVPLGLSDIANRETDRDTLLQLLFCMGIEPKIGQERPYMIYDFPASQAALAQISRQDTRVAERFEVYYKGVELANGFHELADAREQLIRFQQDNKKRVQQGMDPQPIDMNFIAALEAGFPNCAGVAVGIDRLVMLALNQDHISKVLAFDVNRG